MSAQWAVAADIDLTDGGAERCRHLEEQLATAAARLDHFAGLAAAAPTAKTSGAILSLRELEALEATARGLAVAEISDELFLSVNTIKTHLRGAYRKIGARDRVQALAWWYTHPEAAQELDRQRAQSISAHASGRLAASSTRPAQRAT